MIETNLNSRRGFLRGLAGILAAGVAPAIILTPKLLMPVKPLPAAFANWAWTEEESGVITGMINFEVVIKEVMANAGVNNEFLKEVKTVRMWAPVPEKI